MNPTAVAPRFSAGRFSFKPKAELPESEATIVRANAVTYVQNRRERFDNVEYGTKTFDEIRVTVDPQKALQEKPAAPPAEPAPAQVNTEKAGNKFVNWVETQGRSLARFTRKTVAQAKAKAKPVMNYMLKLKAERDLFKFLQQQPNLDARYETLPAEQPAAEKAEKKD